MDKRSLKYFTKNTLPAEHSVPINKGEGIYFWDINGKQYMDFASQTLNLLFGQCHPKIVNAVVEQARLLTYASSRFGTVPYYELINDLVAICPDNINSINLKMCDGSDANETAVKIARKYTEKRYIVSFNNAHTGQTTQTIHLRGYDKNRKLLIGSTEDVIFIDPPLCKTKDDYLLSLRELSNILDSNNDIAGIIIDPIMVNAGVLVNENTSKYLKGIENICKKNKVIFIIDENQSFGWLPDLFASKYYGISPDIITLGKGLAGGYPLAGVVMKDYLSGVLDYNEADFTNGGNPISCVAASVAINMLKNEDFKINEKSNYLSNCIFEILKNSRFEALTRSVGLIHCIEIAESNDVVDEIYSKCINDGLFLRKYKNKLIIKPPIIVTTEQIEKAMLILNENLV